MKVALITGGARRIGSEITRTLMEAGWYVIVHCNRSVDEANALISSGNGAVISVDLGEEDAAEKLSEMVRGDVMVKERGGLDLMIHNASIYREMPFEKVDAKTIIIVRGRSITTKTKFWTFFTTHLPLVDKRSK